MRALSNVAKIGDAALLHVFSTSSNSNFERVVQVHKDQIKLSSLQVSGQKRQHLYVWGIKNGLIKIPIHRSLSGTVDGFLNKHFSDNQNELKKYSHFVLIEQFTKKPPHVHPDGETIDIYRLPNNFNDIEETIADSIGPQPHSKLEKLLNKVLFVICICFIAYEIIMRVF